MPNKIFKFGYVPETDAEGGLADIAETLKLGFCAFAPATPASPKSPIHNFTRPHHTPTLIQRDLKHHFPHSG